jgi:hypothetical protein
VADFQPPCCFAILPLIAGQQVRRSCSSNGLAYEQQGAGPVMDQVFMPLLVMNPSPAAAHGRTFRM